MRQFESWEFQPILSVLEPPQRRLWDELGIVANLFVLCGGTAVALQLGHRSSVDFDFLSASDFDPDDLLRAVGFLKDSRVIQKSASTLTCTVDRAGPVKISFFGTPSIQWIASLVDLAGMKAAVCTSGPRRRITSIWML